MATRTESDTATIAPKVGRSLDLARFSETGFGRVILADTPEMKVVLVALESGQEIPPHAPAVNLSISVLDGDGQIRIDDYVHNVRAGDVAVIPSGAVRGIRGGGSGLIALHVVAPPPTNADHEALVTDYSWPDQSAAGMRISEEVSGEHRNLRPSVELLSDLADSVGMLDPSDRRVALDETLGFLKDHLLPHASAEESELYPAAERVLRARGGAVGTMTLGHEAISALVDELSEAAARDDVDSLPRILHSLRAVVLLHLDEEEKVYLPALAGLSAAEAKSIAKNLGLSDV
jgi:quercetin dioxygenase-like cupin family protein/hemerythrin-like domain-containing protein